MKKILTLSLSIFFLLLLNTTSFAQSEGDYRSAATGNWDAAASWQRFTAGSWVPAPAAPTSADGVISIRTGNTITIAAAVTADQIVVDAGGILTMNSDLTLNNGTGDDLTVSGTFNWNSSTLGGAGNAVISAGGTFNFATPSGKFISAPITNNGTLNWVDGTIFFNATTTLTNSGTMTISGNNSINNNSGTGSFVNNGTVTKSSVGITTFNLGTVTNAGPMNLNAGTLNNSATWNNTAAMNFNGGTFTQTSGTFNHNAGSVISGTGNFNNGGTLNLNIDQVFPAGLLFGNTSTVQGAGNLTINNDFVIAGTIQGAGTLTINGNTTWNSGTLGRALTIGAGNTLTFATANQKIISAAITNNGTLNWADGTIFFNATTTLTNSGTMTISGNNSINNNSGTGSFVNNGTVTKSSVGITTFNLGTVTNAGPMNLNAGTLNNSATWNNTAAMNFNGGTFTQTSGTFNHNAGSVISGTGNFNNGGTLNLNIDQVFPATLIFANTSTVQGVGNLTINNDFVIAGTIQGAGTLTINGNTTWNSGTLGRALTIGAGNTLTFATANQKIISAAITNNGTLNWVDGTIFFNATTTLTNNGTMTINGNNSINNNSGTGSFVNNGTVTKSSTGTTTFSLGTVTNAGPMNLNAGTLQNNSTTWNNTAAINFAGGIFNNQAGLAFNHNTGSLISGTGNFNNNSILNLNIDQVFPATLIFANTSTVQGAGNLTINNDFVIAGTIQGAGTLTINGNTTWNSGILGRALTIGAGNTLTFATANQKIISAAITNNGTLNWVDGTIFFNATTTLTNNGTMTINGNNSINNNAGTGSFVNNGTVTKSSTGTTTFSLGTFTNSNTGVMNGLGTFAMNNTIFNSNGAIAPGLSPGLLTINNNQPLSSNSTLQIELLDGSGAGTGHDQLVRSSSITLAGTLTVTEIGTVPNGTYTIINLTAGTVSGSFTTINLPAGYTLQVNANNVQLVRNLVLPVRLISFTAEKQSDKVALIWKTDNEQNAKHFDVERSADGINYTVIGTVAAFNTQGLHTYKFTDYQPLSKKNFYRLRQVDFDNSFEISRIVRVDVDKDVVLIISPNPVSNQLILQGLKIGSRVKVFDAAGKLMLSQLWSGRPIDASSLSKGIYYLHTDADGEITTAKFLKQ